MRGEISSQLIGVLLEQNFEHVPGVNLPHFLAERLNRASFNATYQGIHCAQLRDSSPVTGAQLTLSRSTEIGQASGAHTATITHTKGTV